MNLFERFRYSFYFMPDQNINKTPSDYALPYHEISLDYQNGDKLKGWYIESDQDSDKPVIYFLHGNRGNLSHYLDFFTFFRQHLDYPIFAIDYRGYGESTGQTTEQNMYQDAEKGWEYLLENHNANQIVIMGHSLGTSVASWLCQSKIPKALVLISPFVRMQVMFRDVSKKIRGLQYKADRAPFLYRLSYLIQEIIVLICIILSFLVRDFDSMNYLKGKSDLVPTLIVHSTEDDYIDYAQARQIYESLNGTREFITINGSHDNPIFTEQQIHEIGRFIN